ncbi:MAG: flagella basal body P-ring formation protein FlgA [Phycisphaerales bacterium]|nr:MAG: flagella basal body P-ring formation protein FlgA [Phycisphaerales bacterium]
MRLWPKATVVSERITLADVCELSGFDRQTLAALSELEIADAPSPGQQGAVEMRDLRSAIDASRLALSGMVRFVGASRCQVSRPAPPSLPSIGPGDEAQLETPRPLREEPPAAPPPTLRDLLLKEIQRRPPVAGARVEAEFNPADRQVLALTASSCTFRITLGEPDRHGVATAAVEINGATDESLRVQIACHVTWFAPIVVARRPVNRGMTIRDVDVGVVEMKLSTSDRDFATHVQDVVGRRSKSFFPAGQVIATQALEDVPVVTRNQLIRLVSVVGGIRVETAARSTDVGSMGDVVTVRSLDDRVRVFEAVVTGPGEVTLAGRNPTREEGARVAQR